MSAGPAKGCFCLLLHTHMPYVRKNGAWPVGEDWLYQVMSDTYLPLLELLGRLEEAGAGARLALTLTPVLCEQLADPYTQDRFAAYLRTMEERSLGDVNDFIYFADEKRKSLAEAYGEKYRRKLAFYLDIDRDILGALASFERNGTIETLASAATHCFMPGLADESSVRRQISLGISSHEGRLGAGPRGFWLPECAYRAGVEEVLADNGIDYFIVDSTALAGRPVGRPYLVGGSDVVAFARSDRAHLNAWDEESGYPTNGSYLDSTKYYDGSGLHYWRVTGPDVPIESKEPYDPAAARARALRDAEHYVLDVASEIDSISGRDTGDWSDPPLVLAAYDTEFLGHGWKEGIAWLEMVLQALSSDKVAHRETHDGEGPFLPSSPSTRAAEDVNLTLPSRFMDEQAERGSADLRQTTWGTGRDSSTWLNPRTAWMWEEIAAAQERFAALSKSRFDTDLDGRALVQACRELMLLESSDWPYMVAKDRARDYAIERFRTHLGRFGHLAEAMETGGVNGIEKALGEIEEADNIFAGLDLGFISGR